MSRTVKTIILTNRRITNTHTGDIPKHKAVYARGKLVNTKQPIIIW